MKKVLLTTALLLVMGLQLCFAQKSQSSDYNLRKAYEMLEQKDEKEALKYINQHIKDNPKLLMDISSALVCISAKRSMAKH